MPQKDLIHSRVWLRISVAANQPKLLLTGQWTLHLECTYLFMIQKSRMKNVLETLLPSKLFSPCFLPNPFSYTTEWAITVLNYLTGRTQEWASAEWARHSFKDYSLASFYYGTHGREKAPFLFLIHQVKAEWQILSSSSVLWFKVAWLVSLLLMPFCAF